MLRGTIAPTGVLVKVDGNFPVRFFVKWQMHPFKGCMLEFNLSLRGVIVRRFFAEAISLLIGVFHKSGDCSPHWVQVSSGRTPSSQ
jgi:hypothetical protein